MSPEIRGQGPDATEISGQQQVESTSQPNAPSDIGSVVGGFLIWIFIGLVSAWNTVRGEAFLRDWWPYIVVGIVLLLGSLLITPFRLWLKTITPKAQIMLIISVVVPCIVIIIAMPFSYKEIALRLIFLLVVCLFPAILYYLFIAVRRQSLLNEFITNLDRLGFLTQGANEEAELNRQRRVHAYVRKFEAIYGPLNSDLVDQIVKATSLSPVAYDRRWPQTGLGEILTETPFPVVLAIVLIAVGWLFTFPLVDTDRDLIDQLPLSMDPEKKRAVQFAFLGAYFFSLQMLFRRYVRRDLRTTAYSAVSVRMILAFIGIWVVVEAVKELEPNTTESALSVLGFSIGVFPRVAWQVLLAATKKISGAAKVVPSLETKLPISDLDGLTVWHEARLEEEDIENIPNMATADLVELMVNTRFPPDRIVDWVDQAILYTHLGPEQGEDAAESPRRKLRAHGIRSAHSLVKAYEDSQTRNDQAGLEKILDGTARSPVRSLVDTVATNPNLQLIQIWRQKH